MKYDDIRDFGFTKPFDNISDMDRLGFNVIRDVNRLSSQPIKRYDKSGDTFPEDKDKSK